MRAMLTRLAEEVEAAGRAIELETARRANDPVVGPSTR